MDVEHEVVEVDPTSLKMLFVFELAEKDREWERERGRAEE